MTRDGAATRLLDEVLEFAKRFQERYHAAAYAELAETARRRLLSKELESIAAKGSPAESPQTILIFKPDDIGDAVCALPSLLALRRAHPRAWIGILCQKKTAALYERTGLADQVVGIPVTLRWRRFPFLDVKQALAHFPHSQFDVGIFLRTYPTYFDAFKRLPMRTAIFPLDPRLDWKPTKVRALTPLVSLYQEQRPHQIQQLWEILAPLLPAQSAPPPGDPLQAEFPAFQWKDEDRVAGIPDAYVVLHPFNDRETKRIPVAVWQDLVEKIRSATGLPILVIGGANDGEFPLSPGVSSLQGKLNLAQSGYLLSRATAFLGTSSGPAHWAAALGTPTLGLLSGHTASEEWRFSREALGLRVKVPCSPCHLRTCNRHGLKCIRELTPERIWPPLEEFLGNVQRGARIPNQDRIVYP